MIIGIDGSRAFLPERTGIEEYSYQVIRHLRETLLQEPVFLYVRSGQQVPFELPHNWTVKELCAPRLWTQVRLSLEMLFFPVDALFIPAHTAPLIHPKKTIVTIHGLEYEFCPKAYSFLERWYMRLSIRFSCRAASTLIAVSENTKSDLMKLYGVPESKIQVVYEGYEDQSTVSNEQPTKKQEKPYLLFIGRLEERKNVVRIIEAFEILKEQHRIPHQLILAGKPGYGYGRIKYQISNIKYRDEVVELGYVSEEEKWALLRGADVFIFPSLYEGFGIPVLEAQSSRVPVITSDISSLPEVGGEGVVTVNPLSPEDIAEGIQKVLSDEEWRGDIIKRATHNVSRFSWIRCAKEIEKLLIE